MSRKKKVISRKKNFSILIFTLFCVFGLTIVYAALNSTLNISGSAQVSSSEWSFKMEKMDLSGMDALIPHYDNYLFWGDGKLTKEGVISGTTVSNYEVSLSKPDDSVTLVYTITNTGTLPAKFLSINQSTDTIYSKLGSSYDEKWGEENLIFDGFLFDKYGQVKYEVGHIICPGETVSLTANSQINENATTLPEGDLYISGLKTEVVFGQTDDPDGVCDDE